MKRRSFVRQFGKGITTSLLLPGNIKKYTGEEDLFYDYPRPTTLDDLKNDEGLVAVDLSASINDQHVLVCWLDRVSGESELSVRIKKETFRFSMTGIITSEEVIHENENIRIIVHGLPYHEIGVIDPQKMGIPNDLSSYRFVIMADPQGGDPSEPTNDSPTRIKIHNAFIEESIGMVNELEPSSLFTLVLGDFTDSKGQARNFNQMIEFYKKLQQPVLLEIGNHETPYVAIFTPGYNMTEFNNYFASQKKINGLEKLLYSFDIGEWHFIVWPDPLRNNFWETHPHYFDWLERDLEKNVDRPVFFFQHVPIHPVGINPLVSYVNPVHINRLLFDILSRHGNIKYVFSGHVHIPLRASNKTAVSYKGIRMINLPPTGYRPRAFGEEDYYGGPSQGICLVDVDGKKAEVHFQTVTREIFSYPRTFREYSSEMDPLWFQYKWELAGNNEILNGSFENGLDAWLRPFIYREDNDPSNKKEILPAPGRQGNALYLFTRKRGYDTPGQDRLPQTLNRITQVVRAPSERAPTIRFAFMIDGSHYFPGSWNGGFLWLEGYNGPRLVLSQVYVIGKGTYSLGGSYGRNVKSTFYDITDVPDTWHDALINVADDYRRSGQNGSLLTLDIDKYAVNLGTWTINDGFNQEIGVFIDEVHLDFNFIDHAGASRLDDKPIGMLDAGNIFAARIYHEAGEHKYASQAELYPF
jgi:3',5'-cyclic AMP phosphodiesterase CpdA